MPHHRILWADNLKGFLILLVVLGHTIQFSVQDYDCSHVFNYIYSFHMPLFMLLSGFCSYKPDFKSISIVGGAKSRGKQLLFPYTVWTLVFCLLIGLSLWRSLFEVPVYWFLLLLFFISVLMTICQYVAQIWKLKSEIVCVFTVAILFCLHAILNTKILSLNILHVHFCFYTIGWYIRKYESKLLYNYLVYSAGLLTIILGWFYHRNSSPYFMPSVPASFYFMLTGIVGSLFFIGLFHRFADKEWSFMNHIGRLTLGIYVTHLVICGVSENYMRGCVSYMGNELGVMVLFVTVAIISIILSILMEKNMLTRLLVGLK